MSHIFYLRDVSPPVQPSDVDAMLVGAKGCFNLHRVTWRHSVISNDGTRMLCWYEAPDTESARNALRQLGSDMNAVWPGTVEVHGDLLQAVLMLESTQDRLPDVATLPNGIDEIAHISSGTDKQVIALYCASRQDTAQEELSRQCGVAATPCTVVTPKG